jgi:hypothetical protein
MEACGMGHLTTRFVALVAAMLLGATGATAGKYCGDLVEGGKASGPTQEEALKAAQSWWSSRAGSLGRGYETWDNAEGRAMECSQDGQGMFFCRATGKPCLPDGTLPDNLPKIEM